jgi:hypothetical protein
MKTTWLGRVRKIIKPPHPSLPEKAEISVHGADELYREIRIENVLVDENGKKHGLREDADVKVIIEADLKSTFPKDADE